MADVEIPAQAVGTSRWFYSSDLQASVVLPAVAADLTLPSVVVPATPIPSGTSIAKVYAAVQWRKQTDSSGSANAVNGAQTIQLQPTGGSTWTDCVDIPDNSLSTAASAAEGGPFISGTYDVSSVVTGAGTYDFQWASALVDGASLTLADFQCIIMVFFS